MKNYFCLLFPLAPPLLSPPPPVSAVTSMDLQHATHNWIISPQGPLECSYTYTLLTFCRKIPSSIPEIPKIPKEPEQSEKYCVLV